MDRFKTALARLSVLAAPLLAMIAPQANASLRPAAPQAAAEDIAGLNADLRRALDDDPSTPASRSSLRSTGLAADVPIRSTASPARTAGVYLLAADTGPVQKHAGQSRAPQADSERSKPRAKLAKGAKKPPKTTNPPHQGPPPNPGKGT